MKNVNFTPDDANSTSQEPCYNLYSTEINIDELRVPYIALCALNVFFAIVAFLGNALHLLTHWLNPDLHSSSHILLVGLALTDLLIGLIGEPLYVIFTAGKIFQMEKKSLCNWGLALNSVSGGLCVASLLTMAAINFDGYLGIQLHLRYVEVVTKTRCLYVLTSIWVLSLFLGGIRPLSFTTYVVIIVITICLSLCVTTFSYVKIYGVLRRHRAAIQAQSLSQEDIDKTRSLTRNKKTAFCMLLVYCLMILCYFPTVVMLAVLQIADRSILRQLIFELTISLVFLNSSLNPFVFYWRLSDVRRAVNKTLRKIRNICLQ